MALHRRHLVSLLAPLSSFSSAHRPQPFPVEGSEVNMLELDAGVRSLACVPTPEGPSLSQFMVWECLLCVCRSWPVCRSAN